MALKGEKKFMEMALKLALKGQGFVSPNPMVGAVVVKGGKAVGKGWHKRFGGKHAEINALDEAGRKAKGADLYVTLEPCSHYGKQPPCTKSIVKAGIKRVFVAMNDPNPVSKHGGKELERRGIRVLTGLCRSEAEKLNEFYITSLRKARPFIALKIAMSIDAKISYGNMRGKKISGKKAFEFTQDLRKKFDAVLVGVNTVILDNPGLDVRGKPELNPRRIVLDSGARTPLNSKIFSLKGETIIACTRNAPGERLEQLRERGAEIIVCGRGRKVDLKTLMKKLYGKGVRSVLVEAGSETAASFLGQKLFDKVFIVVAGRRIGEGLEAFRLERKVKAKISKTKKLGKDLLLEIEG